MNMRIPAIDGPPAPWPAWHGDSIPAAIAATLEEQQLGDADDLVEEESETYWPDDQEFTEADAAKGLVYLPSPAALTAEVARIRSEWTEQRLLTDGWRMTADALHLRHLAAQLRQARMDEDRAERAANRAAQRKMRRDYFRPARAARKRGFQYESGGSGHAPVGTAGTAAEETSENQGEVLA